MYRYVDAALVRAAAYPTGLVLPDWPNLSDTAEANKAVLRSWIEQVWQLQPVVDAVELASPVLARRIRRICAEKTSQPKQVRRAATSLHRYLLRLQHRSTPFGLFAGVASVRFGTGADWRWGDEHRPSARVDAVWLSEVIGRLESFPELLRRLPVVADSTGFVRDGRWVLPCQRPSHDADHGPGEISVRHTPAVETVLTAASSAVAVGELAERLIAAYPGIPAETVEGLLAELVARRVLLTGLRPPMTMPDALGHVIDQLDAVQAADIAEVAPTVRTLRRIRSRLERHGTAEPSARRHLRAEVSEAMRTCADAVEAPLALDLRLNCSLTLPKRVAQEAEKAANVLARLTPFPAGAAAWRQFHAGFLERYGTGTLVPLTELAGPNAGLDLPAGYRGSLLAPPAQALTARDGKLLALAQTAALDGANEVALTRVGLNDLEVEPGIPLPHVDLRFRLQAASRPAVDGGDFTLAITGVSPTAGATAGRFLDLLDTADRERMIFTYNSLPTLERNALRAQVSSPPLNVRTDNVSRTPALGAPVIPVGEPHSQDAQMLPLGDLAITADTTRLMLVQISTNKTVEPTVLNSVDLKHFTHPLARLLCELPRAHCGAFGPFAWGAAAQLPFLPRIRHGRTVLSPAIWQIKAAELPGPRAPLTQWTRSLTALRQRLGLPACVQLGDDDKRLHLTLDHSADSALLRAELDRTGHAILREAPERTAYGWFDGRPHEITLALASTADPAPASSSKRVRAVPVGRDHGHLPGVSTWAYLKLYGHPDHAPVILTRHLSRLWENWDGPPPQWWFLRYRDPCDHLRLRIRLAHPDTFGRAASLAGAWAADLRQRGLLSQTQWDTYFPETGRYGSGPVMTAAETVFAADSAAAIAELTLTHRSGVSAQALTAASLVDLATGFTGDVDAAMQWLMDHVTTDTAPHPTRPVHREAMRLAHPREGRAAIQDLPGGDQVTAAWTPRRKALNAYRAAISADGQLRPEAVLPSLLHVHHLRTAGINQADEHICHRLARSAALAFTVRREGALQ